MNITSLLVRRLLFSVQDKTIKRMMLICCISIGIATFALALVAAVMNGFDQETRSVVQGVQPDITINAGKKALKYSELEAALLSHASSYISAITPMTIKHGMIKFHETAAPVMIIAIDPSSFEKVTQLHKRLIDPTQNFLEIFKNDGILIGQTLAQSYLAKPEDSAMLLYSTQEDNSERVMLEEFPIKIAGVFKTGIDEIDSHIVFCSYDLFEKLYGNRTVTSVGIKATSHRIQKKLLQVLREKFSLTITSWEDLYPAILSALTLEKFAMLLILALIVLIASMNIIALLFMYISHKRIDIAVLLSMGLGKSHILHTFVIIGLFISLVPALVGLTLAMIVSWLLHHYPLITLPDAYYVSHLPALMDVSIVLEVLLIVSLISYIAARLGSRQIIGLSTTLLTRQT